MRRQSRECGWSMKFDLASKEMHITLSQGLNVGEMSALNDSSNKLVLSIGKLKPL